MPNQEIVIGVSVLVSLVIGYIIGMAINEHTLQKLAKVLHYRIQILESDLHEMELRNKQKAQEINRLHNELLQIREFMPAKDEAATMDEIFGKVNPYPEEDIRNIEWQKWNESGFRYEEENPSDNC